MEWNHCNPILGLYRQYRPHSLYPLQQKKKSHCRAVRNILVLCGSEMPWAMDLGECFLIDVPLHSTSASAEILQSGTGQEHFYSQLHILYCPTLVQQHCSSRSSFWLLFGEPFSTFWEGYPGWKWTIKLQNKKWTSKLTVDRRTTFVFPHIWCKKSEEASRVGVVPYLH